MPFAVPRNSIGTWVWIFSVAVYFCSDYYNMNQFRFQYSALSFPFLLYVSLIALGLFAARAAIAELQDLQRHVDRQLPGIACPALVVHGARDHTVTLAGARRLARRIGSGPAELVILPRSWHLIGIDVERDRCAAEVVALVRSAGAGGTARSD